MADEKVLVEVFDGKAVAIGCGCSAPCGSDEGCGADISWKEATEKLACDLSRTYGEKVEVKYVDTREKGIKAYPMIQRLAEVGYPFPIISIGGKPRLAGAIDVEQIQSMLDEVLSA
ncbi:hypothetical protein [Syntrophothermus lipocalidus]|uniref:Arsenical resistance operon trans-acting repressor ArsD n=1 Tax=Syntrophothermus lipocalidus (strain DSM 12680 / TGB-C1) TaxID=643648 RepID=D7CJH7_SYNLT|nr:hypothetical protein [Syntrophothermus lipocalidus]ADI02932.1 hypothetical protein Slip_2190 [Syntrophothermus lipocalidus DSM 12680]